MKRRSAIVLVLALCAGFVIVGATAAWASWGCYWSDAICLYHDAGGNGPWDQNQAENNDYFWDGFNYNKGLCNPCWLNDEVSSLDSWDDMNKLRIFVDKNYDGTRQTLAVYGRDSQADSNDAYSSHCWNNQGSTQPQTNGTEDPDCTF